MSHEEKTLLLTLKSAAHLELNAGVLDVLVNIADLYINRGETQEGADVLAFVLRQANLPDDIHENARELYEDLETWICPRVLMDAQYFAERATLEDIIEYVLAD